MSLLLHQIDLHERCKEMAREIIDSDGSDPAYIVIVETVDEFFSYIDDIEDLSEKQYEDLQEHWVAWVEAYISSATITIEFPNLEDEEG